MLVARWLSLVGMESGLEANKQPLKLEEATVEDFRSLLYQKFAVASSEGGQSITELTLVEAEQSGRGIPGFRDPFSLIFEGAPEIRLEQQMFWMSTEGLGEIPIFIVPLGVGEKSCRYQAVFN